MDTLLGWHRLIEVVIRGSSLKRKIDGGENIILQTVWSLYRDKVGVGVRELEIRLSCVGYGVKM